MECFPVFNIERTPIGRCGLTQNAIFLPDFLPETFATIELCQQRCQSTQSCQVNTMDTLCHSVDILELFCHTNFT